LIRGVIFPVGDDDTVDAHQHDVGENLLAIACQAAPGGGD